jgi:hypothetical protein
VQLVVCCCGCMYELRRAAAACAPAIMCELTRSCRCSAAGGVRLHAACMCLGCLWAVPAVHGVTAVAQLFSGLPDASAACTQVAHCMYTTHG